jgi:prepilin-type N-terminal cleavage/methylation domain-containing protein
MRNYHHKRFVPGKSAFTLVEIMIVAAILGLLVSIAVPYYTRQRSNAQANVCINTLLKLDDAACQFALERGRKSGDPVNYPQDLTPYIKLNGSNQIPPCPAGGSYSLNTIGAMPVCSLGSSVSPFHILP